jgi:hypothetical protein
VLLLLASLQVTPRHQRCASGTTPYNRELMEAGIGCKLIESVVHHALSLTSSPLFHNGSVASSYHAELSTRIPPDRQEQGLQDEGEYGSIFPCGRDGNDRAVHVRIWEAGAKCGARYFDRRNHRRVSTHSYSLSRHTLLTLIYS